jgi:pyrroline-5-carboxylate reductase
MKAGQYRIGFIGFGHMAQTLFKSMDHFKLISRSQILFTRRDPAKARKNQEEFGITSSTIEHIVQSADLIILGTRPQDLSPVLNELQKFDLKNLWVISIVTGHKISHLQKFLKNCSIIRAMPNLPISVGEGMTSLAMGPNTPSEFQSFTRLLFRGMGKIIEIKEEELNFATGIAGSGPAYVFALIEAAARFAESKGISYESAKTMAAQMFLGASKMVLESKGEIADLIQHVTVPKGTTDAGFSVFNAAHVAKEFVHTLERAASRAEEIARENS